MIQGADLRDLVNMADLDRFLHDLNDQYGYDFSHYAKPSLLRRIDRAKTLFGAETYAELFQHIVRDKTCFDRFVQTISITVTKLFWDPSFFRLLREKVLPALRNTPVIRIWHVGCATGEEACSMAIVLHEEELLDRAHIYASDFKQHALNLAEEAVYPVMNVLSRSSVYLEAGGSADLTDYYCIGYYFANANDAIKHLIKSVHHNLAKAGTLGDIDLICCRNVLIYFDKTLQNRVLAHLSECLRPGGFLGLGARETLDFSDVSSAFRTLDPKQRIYKKSNLVKAIDAFDYQHLLYPYAKHQEV